MGEIKLSEEIGEPPVFIARPCHALGKIGNTAQARRAQRRAVGLAIGQDPEARDGTAEDQLLGGVQPVSSDGGLQRSSLRCERHVVLSRAQWTRREE
jgi:hypothetical protein